MLKLMKRINWGTIAAVLYCLGVWAVVGWVLYHGLTRVQ